MAAVNWGNQMQLIVVSFASLGRLRISIDLKNRFEEISIVIQIINQSFVGLGAQCCFIVLRSSSACNMIPLF